jgi:hypothetical protein
MPDSFPTLDVAALLGVLVLTLRVVSLRRMVAEVARLNDKLVAHLDTGNLERALALCEAFDTAVYPIIARRIVRMARQERPDETVDQIEAGLRRAFETSYAAQAQRVRGAMGRDLVVLAVLLGASAYAWRADVGASSWFFAVCGAGVLLLVASAFGRRRLLAAAAMASGPLLAAAARATTRARPPRAPPRCPTCGRPWPSSDLVPASEPSHPSMPVTSTTSAPTDSSSPAEE